MTLALMSTPRTKKLASRKHSAKRKSMHPWGTVDMRHGIAGPGFGSEVGVRLTAKGPQAKLEVNEPNDRFEQEADRVADEVMRMPGSTISLGSACDDGKQPSCSPHHFLQRKLGLQRLCTG